MECRVKIQSDLIFDDETESKLIEHIKSLKKRRVLGEYLTDCVREKYKSSKKCISEVSRDKYKESVKETLVNLGDKIERTYDYILKLYIISEMGMSDLGKRKINNLIEEQLKNEESFNNISKNIGFNYRELIRDKYVREELIFEVVNTLLEKIPEDVKNYIRKEVENEKNNELENMQIAQQKIQMEQQLEIIKKAENKITIQIQELTEKEIKLSRIEAELNVRENNIARKEKELQEKLQEKEIKEDDKENIEDSDSREKKSNFEETADFETLLQFIGETP